MSRAINLTGRKFGMLTVIRKLETVSNRSRWECQCECGNLTIGTGDTLQKGDKRSCGCYRRIRTAQCNKERHAQPPKTQAWRDLWTAFGMPV